MSLLVVTLSLTNDKNPTPISVCQKKGGGYWFLQLDSGVAHIPKGKTLRTKSLGTQTDVHWNLNTQLIPACHLWWLLSLPLYIGLGNIDIWAGKFVMGGLSCAL